MNSTNQSIPSHIAGVIATPTPGAIYFGAYVAYPNAQSTTQTASFEQSIYGTTSRHMALNMHYVGWIPSKWDMTQINDDWSNGRVPVISWNCGAPDSQIANSTQWDSTILEAVNQLSSSHPVFLRWFWEMNLKPSDNGRTSCEDNGQDTPVDPTEWKLAYEHIHALLASKLPNVTWVFSPAASSGINFTAMNQYYPGDPNVDWIGFDAYERDVHTFHDTFANAYNDIIKPPSAGGLGSVRPIFVTETGSNAMGTQSGDQPEFFSNAVSDLKADFPRMGGFMYFDSNGGQLPWAVIPGTLGWTDFITMVNDPYMSATVPF